MKKYFIHDGTEQKGAFTFEELQLMFLPDDLKIWHEGLDNWTEITNVPELKDLLKNKSTPPPFIKSSPPPFTKSKNMETAANASSKQKIKTSLILEIFAIVVFVIGFAITQYISGVNSGHPYDWTGSIPPWEAWIISARITAIVTFIILICAIVFKYNEKNSNKTHIELFVIINAIYILISQLVPVFLRKYDSKEFTILLTTILYVVFYFVFTRKVIKTAQK